MSAYHTLDRPYPYLIPLYDVWMQETTQRRIKPVGLVVVIAGSLVQEMLVPDVTLSVMKGWS